MTARFLQIHTLTSYPASLLNRDDAGFAKRIPFGGATRTRVSSQCLKRHWRTADDEHALDRIEWNGEAVPMSVRSRRTFRQHVFDPLVAEGVAEPVAEAVTQGLLEGLLGESKKAKAAREKAEAGGEKADVDTKQVTVIGRPEVEYLRQVATSIAREADGDAKAAREAIKERLKDKAFRENLPALGMGLDAALFGRMTTGDVLARTDAAVHVAHAFTVHAGQHETDYFSAVDDLQDVAETGSGHINTAELASGLFYGYVVVDVPLLVSNLSGTKRQEWQSETDGRALAAEVLRRFVHLMTTVSPGAKLGSTAPHAYAHLVLAEAGDAQPRTLANAFLDPVRAGRGDGGLVPQTYQRLAEHLRDLDTMYRRRTERRVAALGPLSDLDALGERTDLDGVAGWVAAQVRGS